ncbi:MAG: hypothetical protein QOE70_4020 [Chthoniobacter sp.]|nr:hypothetical protein [Chthoniobacter sp.]
MSTPRTDRWKADLRQQLTERGEKVALARFLCDGDESQLKQRVVQLAKVLNQGALPKVEFVLAVEEWKTLRNQKEPRNSRTK